MSAAVVELIASTADLPAASAPPDLHESTRRMAVAAHLAERRVRRALDARGGAPEPGVDLARLRKEAEIARRREAARRLVHLGAAGILLLLRPTQPVSWLGALCGLFLVEFAFHMARRLHVLAHLAPGAFASSPPAPAGPAEDGATEAVPVVGSPEAPFPGTGEEVDRVVLALDLGKPREAGRTPRHLRLRDLESELETAVRRLWLARLDVRERWYAETPGGRARRYVVLELPVGHEGALITSLVRFERRGDGLLAEIRFRYLPPVSRAFRGESPQHPRREAGGLARDVAASVLRAPAGWLEALGWIGSGVIRPAVAVARAEAGVQERSLRERFACDAPSPSLETERTQLTALLRGRVLDALEESLVRRGICPGPVQACATRGDVVVVEDSPARALPRPRRNGRRNGKPRGGRG